MGNNEKKKTVIPVFQPKFQLTEINIIDGNTKGKESIQRIESHHLRF